MRGAIQDGIRWAIGVVIALLGHLFEIRHAWRIATSGLAQRHLRIRYSVRPETPILTSGPALDARLTRFAEGQGTGVRFAMTSGSAGTPKRIPFTKRRVRAVTAVYEDAFARSFAALPIRRTSLYVFSALASDDSLSAMMMAERADLPPYLSTLQAPYRVQNHPTLRALAETYGSGAVRLWVMVLANPGCLYATNPSTLSVFLDALEGRWTVVTGMVRAWHRAPHDFDLAVHDIARRLASEGWRERVTRITRATSPMSLLDCVPAIEMFCCWDGGYVRPFLDRVQARLPPERVRHVPMYSMSTETVETIVHFRGQDVSFLPLAPGVFYEFLPVDSPDEPAALLRPAQLEVGAEYTMVVSDAYGLLRYQTEDVFAVVGKVAGLPDLRFRRRCGLSWSFTGEKLTGEHLRIVFDLLRTAYAPLRAVNWMVCVPSQPPDTALPHYRLLLGIGDTPLDIPPDALARRFDGALCGQNSEYADKRHSGRLDAPRVEVHPLQELVARIGGERHAQSWETQFKFLPLVRRTYEELFA